MTTTPGMPTIDDAVTTIHELRKRVALLERAFTAYITDGLAATASRRDCKPDPPILGLCKDCGFPVYDSDIGEGGRYHYSPQGVMSRPIVCNVPRLEQE